MHKNTRKMLIYGLYAVVCHMCGILFYYSFYGAGQGNYILVVHCAEMLEYSLMSILILCSGGFIMDRINKNESST